MNRLKQQPQVVQQLALFQTSVGSVLQSKVRVFPVAGAVAAASLSRQHSLLTNDANILALMRHHNFTHLASEDTDFDRGSGITRYSPA